MFPVRLTGPPEMPKNLYKCPTIPCTHSLDDFCSFPLSPQTHNSSSSILTLIWCLSTSLRKSGKHKFHLHHIYSIISESTHSAFTHCCGQNMHATNQHLYLCPISYFSLPSHRPPVRFSPFFSTSSIFLLHAAFPIQPTCRSFSPIFKNKSWLLPTALFSCSLLQQKSLLKFMYTILPQISLLSLCFNFTNKILFLLFTSPNSSWQVPQWLPRW